jgi:hypothetical protein
MNFEEQRLTYSEKEAVETVPEAHSLLRDITPSPQVREQADQSDHGPHSLLLAIGCRRDGQELATGRWTMSFYIKHIKDISGQTNTVRNGVLAKLNLEYLKEHLID